MKRQLYEELNRKFGFYPYHTWHVNSNFDKVVAVRNGHNEGSGTDFYYTDFVELWSKEGGVWKRISRSEFYSESQKAKAAGQPDAKDAALILTKKNGGDFTSHNKMVVVD